MDKITELKQERMRLVKQQRNIVDEAEERDGSLNNEEEQKFDRIEEDVKDLEKRIGRLKSVRENEKKKIITDLDQDPQTQSKNQVGNEEYKKAFEGFLRRGRKELTREQASMLREKRAQNVANASKGGYLVPETWESTIIEKLREASIMRRLATVETTSSETNIPISASKPTFGWIDEEGGYPETDEEFANRSASAWKLGGIIKVSEELLYDSAYDLESRIERDAVIGLREMEEEGFVAGDAVKKPRGFLLDAEVGETTAATDAITLDEIINLIYSLKRPYRRNANFLIDDPVAKAVRKLKDNDGQYLWQPSVQQGEPDVLKGYPIEFSYAMPKMSAENKPVAFGDFSYYSVFDRQGMFMQRLDEKYAEQGQIGFKVYRRVDGLLTLPEAVKTLQMSS